MIDLIIPLSTLRIDTNGVGHLSSVHLDLSAVAVVLLKVTEEAIRLEIDGAELNTVSVTVDVTGQSGGEADLSFIPRIDRKTRTLVFASGEAKENGRPLLKATMVFRIG